MGLFSASSPFDADVEKATNENNTTEDWATIMEICDKVGSSSANAKECIRSINKRLYHSDPHVVLQALTLLDACVNNCGKPFHLEVASREFEQEIRKLLQKLQPKVAEKLKYMIKKWAEGDFRSDPQLSLMPSLYVKLKQEGHDFSSVRDVDAKTAISSSQVKDPSRIVSQQEIDDIAKAIELSLKDSKSVGGASSVKSTSLYPSTNSVSSIAAVKSAPSNSTVTKEKLYVKALYDFEAVEDNELTFYSGEVIEVLDNSDKNWWRGCNHRGEGLFPANFVTTDLFSKPKGENATSDDASKKNHVQFDDNTVASQQDQEVVEDSDIEETKINRLLELLHEADPTSDNGDSEEMLQLEKTVSAMGPLIDSELSKADMKHAQLTQLSSNLVEAFNLYHSLMREPLNNPPPLTSHIKQQPYTDPQQHFQLAQQQQFYNGNYPGVMSNGTYAQTGFQDQSTYSSVPGMRPMSTVVTSDQMYSNSMQPATGIPEQGYSSLPPQAPPHLGTYSSHQLPQHSHPHYMTMPPGIVTAHHQNIQHQQSLPDNINYSLPQTLPPQPPLSVPASHYSQPNFVPSAVVSHHQIYQQPAQPQSSLPAPHQ